MGNVWIKTSASREPLEAVT